MNDIKNVKQEQADAYAIHCYRDRGKVCDGSCPNMVHGMCLELYAMRG